MDARSAPRSTSGPATASYKGCREDFEVEELPLYPLAGEGDHTFLFVEKRGRTTTAVASDLARALGVPSSAVGFAGRKDAFAVTRQWFSVEHAPPERVAALELRDARVLEVERHRNKLRLGHLAGNAFRVVVRGVPRVHHARLADELARLERDGLANRFGPQRFGARGDTAEIGLALLRGDDALAVRLIAGAPRPEDHGDVLAARERFEAGEFDAAARTFPRGFELAGRVARAMARERGRARRALRTLRRSERAFFVSAWQSAAFHEVLDLRPGGPGELLEGDVAWDHAARRAVATHGTDEERERVRACELSPAGPLFGPRLRLAEGAAGALEREVLGRQLPEDALEERRAFAGLRGARRPLRVLPREARLRTAGEDAVELVFRLPEGAFATTLLEALGGGRWRDASRSTRDRDEAPRTREDPVSS